MESIFKSMFNLNGNLENNLCELETDAAVTSTCVPSLDLKNCEDKCDCCVKYYSMKKDYDLKMIVSDTKLSLRELFFMMNCDHLGNVEKWTCSQLRLEFDQRLLHFMVQSSL